VIAPTSAPQLVTPKEAARRLSVSLRTMRSMIALRAIPVVRVSSRRLGICETDLAAYVAARREVRA
jgi:excisionase family DNA binding protein